VSEAKSKVKERRYLFACVSIYCKQKNHIFLGGGCRRRDIILRASCAQVSVLWCAVLVPRACEKNVLR